MLRAKTHPNRHLQNAWSKYGEESFRFEIAEEVESKDKAIEREQYWIDVFSSAGKLYNLRPKANSNLGCKFSSEQRQRISNAVKRYMSNPESYAKHCLLFRGDKIRALRSSLATKRWADPEFRKKVTVKLIEANRKRTPEWTRHNSEAVARTYPGFVSPDGVVYENVKNLSKFSLEHGLNQGAMYQVALGKVNHHKGWKRIGWEPIPRKKFSDEVRAKMSLSHKGKPSPNKGKQFSDEARRKMSEAAKNRKRSIKE